MKYIKEFKAYLNENSNGKEFEFSIFNIFKPLGRLISNINTDLKLTNITYGYDEYLYNVYVEYLSRKTSLSKGELDSSEIHVVGEDKKAHISELNTDNNYYNDEDDTYHSDLDIENTKEEDSSTSGNFNKSNSNNDSKGKSYDDIIEEIKQRKYSSMNSIDIDNMFVDRVEAKQFSLLIDDVVNSDSLIDLYTMQKEYEGALKRDKDALGIIKRNITAYDRERRNADSKLLGLKKDSETYIKYLDLREQKTKLLNKETEKQTKLLDKIGQHNWYLGEIKKGVNFLKRKKRDILKAENDAKGIPNDESVDESKNSWNGGGVIDVEWTNSDMIRINQLVNPFQVEEFYLKANLVISKSKNPEASKTKWDMYLNSVYKKWYYTFDVRNLRNLSPDLSNKRSGKDGKGDEVIKEELAYSTLILEELFHNIKSYPYRFKYLGYDKNKYFILLSKNNMMLMKKVLFSDNQYCFQFLSLLKPNKTNDNIASDKMLNNTNDKMEINVNDKTVSLYKEPKNYPILFIKDGNLYTTKDFEDFQSISLKNCNIYSLKDENFKKIIRNSGVVYEDKLPSEQIFDKIKKTNI